MLIAASIVCQLTTVGVTHAYMDGVPNVLVRHCTYKCSDKVSKVHQIYYDDRCPRKIWKNTKSRYRMR